MVSPGAPAWLRELPADETLRRVRVQNVAVVPATDAGRSGGVDAGGGGTIAWRTTAEGFPPALAYIASPHDADVHFAKKRTTEWVGYTRTLVHLTEVCEDDQPHVVTHVETTPAPVVGRDVVARVHRALQANCQQHRRGGSPAILLMPVDGPMRLGPRDSVRVHCCRVGPCHMPLSSRSSPHRTNSWSSTSPPSRAG